MADNEEEASSQQQQQQQQQQAPEGASSLLGLFAPPALLGEGSGNAPSRSSFATPTPHNTVNRGYSTPDKNRQTKQLDSKNANALMGLFAPPVEVANHNRPTHDNTDADGDDDDDDDGSGDDETSNIQTPTPHNTVSRGGDSTPHTSNSRRLLDPKNANALMGLFDPPTASNSNVDNDGTEESPNIDAPSGSVSHFMGLFAPPINSTSKQGTSELATNSDDNFETNEQAASAQSEEEETPHKVRERIFDLFDPPSPSTAVVRPEMERQSTAPRSNKSSSWNNHNDNGERTRLLPEQPLPSPKSPWQSSSSTHSYNSSSGMMMNDEETPKSSHLGRKKFSASELMMHGRMPSVSLAAIDEARLLDKDNSNSSTSHVILVTLKQWVGLVAGECLKPATYIGAFMFLLYHVVFCLAIGSAIIRPGNPTSILGIMTKTAALGIICGAWGFWLSLGKDIPALYPTVDLFLAPFLANLAAGVDATLKSDPNVAQEDNDGIFLTTFVVLSSIGMFISGTLLVLASVFKLANLGSFLPFPVICGFFSAVGVLTWTLAVAVDTGGNSVGSILMSGDTALVWHSLLHHLPSVVVAVIMKFLGPINPLYPVMTVCLTVGLFYAVMFAIGVSLAEAKEMGWFYSHDDFVFGSKTTTVGFESWSVPAPFGVVHNVFQGKVHWGAVMKGLNTAIALGFLYMIRVSVHGTALKKNIPNLARTVKIDDSSVASPFRTSISRPPTKARTFSEAVDIEAVMQPIAAGAAKPTTKVIHAKPTNITLKKILIQYGYSQFISAAVGGFACAPSVGAAPTMYMLGAESVAAQIGSVVLLFVFYLSDFQLAGYIPKPAFSSVLVLSFLDMSYTWFYKSYFKIKDKTEWLVCPAIVIAAFALDLLTAVFVGIALSTFIFVASFFRSGVVKYAANGQVIHSTIDRSFKNGEWLNENGDLIQILVLQNYLFFGNATSVYSYIGTMFENRDEDGEEQPSTELARVPKFVILDLALVTGMDTSTVDVFADIKNLCASQNCKLLMAGMAPGLRATLALSGVKPDTGDRSTRQLRFFASLDTALGKAEDNLLESEFPEKEIPSITARQQRLSQGDHGFRTALRHIDEEHGNGFSMELVALQEHTTLVEVEPGEHLYNQDDIDRGLFFIESGIMKIQTDTDATMTRGSMTSFGSGNSLTKLQARSLGRMSSLVAAQRGHAQSFRLARIGPGWVAGTLEAISGMRRVGDVVAVTHCRLHHLPYTKIEQVEKENPALILNLYKLLSYLMARRQEGTIAQLATLHSIMASPAQLRPLGRKSSKQM